MLFYTNQHRFFCGIDLHERLLALTWRVALVITPTGVWCRWPHQRQP